MIGTGARAGPAAAGAERAPRVRPVRPAARTGSRGTRGRPAAERAPFRMPTPGWLAPDAAERAASPQVSWGAGEGAAAQKRALAVRLGKRDFTAGGRRAWGSVWSFPGVPKLLLGGPELRLRRAGRGARKAGADGHQVQRELAS